MYLAVDSKNEPDHGLGVMYKNGNQDNYYWLWEMAEFDVGLVRGLLSISGLCKALIFRFNYCTVGILMGLRPRCMLPVAVLLLLSLLRRHTLETLDAPNYPQDQRKRPRTGCT